METMRNKPPLLCVDNISASFGALTVLKNVSLSVNEGEFVTIIGPNGAGKTTLLRVISGLLPPTSGKIFFKEKRIDKLPPDNIVNLGISLVPEGRKIWPRMTVLENLELGAYRQNARRKFSENLNLVFELFPVLKERKKQLAGTLSGGEQQMLAIARSLMSNPELLMLDEPSQGLSPIIAEKLFRVIKEINEKHGISIVLVEQNVYFGLELAKRAYVLENGRMVLHGESKELLNNSYVKKAYLAL
jgi:branched-chain amino acid transport system ATP-binding protein